jgi:hypothetical protein
MVIMAERTTDALYELMQERDRLYTERNETIRRELDAYNQTHKQALDKAFVAAKSEQDAILAQIQSTSAINLTMERRISLLEAGRSQDTGRREPIHDVVKWLGAVAIAIFGWFMGHMLNK